MKSDDFVARLRNTLINETLLWLGIVSLPTMALSLSRIATMGWRPVFGLQLLLLSLVWLFWLQRRRIPYSWRLGIILFAMGATGLTAYIQHGPAAIAGQFLLLFLVIAAIFTEGRVAIGLGLLILVGLLVTAWGAVSGTLQFQIDYPRYARDPANWVLIIIAYAGYGGVVALLVLRLFRGLIRNQQQLLQTHAELVRRTEELHTQQIELATQNENLRLSHLELEAVQASYFSLYELAPVVYLTVSKNGLILQVNLAATTLLGVPRGELIGQPISRFILKEDQDVFYLNRNQVLGSGEPKAFELRMERNNGTWFWVHLAATAAQEADGASELRIALSDITERKQAETGVRKLSRAVEQSPAAVLITDRNGNIEYMNPQFEQITGYLRAEVLGRNPRILKSGVTSAETYREMWRVISAGGEWRGELCNRKKCGDLYWEDAAISGLRDESGQITHFIGVKADITANNSAVEALWQARQHEIEIGTNIQRTLLLGEVPEGIEGAQLAAYAEASQVIDGDFYVVRQYRPGCFEVLVGDVMGKGVQAALMGAAITTAYSDALADLLVAAAGALPTPAQIVNAIHQALTRRLIALSSFATLALYRFDLDAGTLTYVNAGHTPGLLTTGVDARPVAILGDNLPIGVMPEENYVQFSVAVGPGDSLLMFSDGITEARNAAGEEFGLERLCGLLEPGSIADLPPATVLHALRGEQRCFNGGGPGTDDLTALMVKLYPRRRAPRGGIADRLEPSVFTLPWSLEGLGGLRARIQECCAMLSEDDANALILGSFEAATNAIRYARLLVGDATLTCRITRQSDAVAVELIYPSAVFTPPAEVQPDFSDQSESGFGLHIIAQSVNSVEYASPMPGIASVRLIKRANAVAA